MLCWHESYDLFPPLILFWVANKRRGLHIMAPCLSYLLYISSVLLMEHTSSIPACRPHCLSPVMLDNNVSSMLAASFSALNGRLARRWCAVRHTYRFPINWPANQFEEETVWSVVALGPRTNGKSKHRCDKMRSGHVISLGTSPLLPFGREPPFTVTKATRGEGVGRCSAHAQCSYLKGTVLGTVSVRLSVTQTTLGNIGFTLKLVKFDLNQMC